MQIDLTNLLTNVTSSINLNENVIISEDLIENSNIRKLENVKFNGKIYNDYENNLVLEGNLTGVMILADDVTLEDVRHEFNSEIYEYIDETFEITQNTIDILDYLWQNILVEVPLKVRGENSKDIKLEGNGWKLITEEELENRTNTPFSELSKLLEKGGNEDGSSI